jgi:hypothetical protein
LALQARPIDGVEITVDDNFSRESLVQQQYGFSAWFNNGSLTDVTLAPDGTVTNFTQPGRPPISSANQPGNHRNQYGGTQRQVGYERAHLVPGRCLYRRCEAESGRPERRLTGL